MSSVSAGRETAGNFAKRAKVVHPVQISEFDSEKKSRVQELASSDRLNINVSTIALFIEKIILRDSRGLARTRTCAKVISAKQLYGKYSPNVQSCHASRSLVEIRVIFAFPSSSRIAMFPRNPSRSIRNLTESDCKQRKGKREEKKKRDGQSPATTWW